MPIVVPTHQCQWLCMSYAESFMFISLVTAIQAIARHCRNQVVLVAVFVDASVPPNETLAFIFLGKTVHNLHKLV